MPVTAVEELTGFPECLDGRVKTLHPNVHAGLLADTRRPEHLAQLDELGVAPFDLLVANLYPFTATVASGATPDECVEQIDIGGPAMVRAAAKNHDSVAVVVDPSRYDWVLDAGRGRRVHPRRPPPARRRGVPAHRHLRRRRRLLAGQRARARRRRPVPGLGRRHLGARRHPALRREPAPGRGALRRGQAAAWPARSSCTARRCRTTTTSTPTPPGAPRTTMATCRRVAVIKHANPCGIAVGADVAEAHRKAHATRPGERVRWRDRGQRRGQRGDGRAGRRGLHRGGRWRRRTPPGRSEILTRKKNVRLLRLPGARPRGGRRDAADLRWPAAAAARPGRRPRRRSRHLDAGHRRPRAGRRAGRPRLRLAGLPRGEVERDPAGLAAGRPSGSGWAR